MSKRHATLLGGALALTASLLLARFHPFGDAGLFAANAGSAPMMDRTAVPVEVRAIFASKCADCHSMGTRAPMYGRFAPVSWLMERDIVRGRAAMNLSEWSSYTPAQQQTLAAKIVRETKEREMPPMQYRMIHLSSRVMASEGLTLSDWARGTAGLESRASGESSGMGDPTLGKSLFEKRCTGCHSLTENREGPRLQGVYGRTAGTAAGFAYSPALKKAEVVWDEASLEKWLTDPDAFIPGDNMDFLVARAQERRDIVSYLRQTSGR